MAALDLPGAINLRDLGGYRGRDGRVRDGVLFRSGALSRLAAAAAADLGARLQVVCDLRFDDERAAEPSVPLGGHVRGVHIPMDPGSAIAMRRELAAQELDAAARIAWMVRINEDLARHHVADYARLFAELGAADGGFLVHCSAGKDRTGWATALILTALGVPWDVVMQDYLLTNELIDFDGYLIPRLRAAYPDRRFDPQAVRAISGVRAEYLEAARRAALDMHGSLERYLERALGVDSAARTALQARLLEA